MSDFIEREAVFEKAFHDDNWRLIIPKSAVEKIPAADAVPVVRCRDCVYYGDTISWNGEVYRGCHHRAEICILEKMEDDYCSYGKRKVGAD